MMAAPGRAAAAVPPGPSRSQAQHNLLSFPGGDNAAPKTVFFAFDTIPTEIKASLRAGVEGQEDPPGEPAGCGGAAREHRGCRLQLWQDLPLVLTCHHHLTLQKPELCSVGD